MYKIQTLNKISAIGLENFDKSKYTYSDDVQNPDAVLVRSAAMHDMQFGDALKAIARAGAGVNNIPLDRCSEEGIVVFNTPGANANAVKELVITGLLLSSRKIVDGINWARTLEGKPDAAKLVEKGKSQFVGPEILGKKLGVIGLGAIGVLVANACIDLGMEVYGYDPYISVDAAWGLSSHVHHSVSLKDIFEKCDYITVHVPLTPETKGLINKQSISSMKVGVRILNFARGDLVDNDDIKEAVASGAVSCYVTDFPSADLIGVNGIIAVPHLGASTPESEDNCANMAAKELIDFLENGNISNSVNMPACSMARSTEVRVCVIHRNVPNMLSVISSAFAAQNINIENMLNKSRHDYAYTIVDVCGTCPDDLDEKLCEIDGILRVRVISK